MPLQSSNIESSFTQSSVRARSFTPLYGLSMFACALCAVFLFLGYLAIIAGLAVGSLAAIRFGVPYFLGCRTIYGIVGGLIAMVMGFIILAKITWLMIRCLFAKSQERHTEIELAPNTEPVLFEFIHRVAASVGAKPPTRIFITGGVDASASTGGVLQTLFGQTRDLRLGMCLFPVLSVTSVGGIVAHECGHFSQSVGMRMQALVRLISSRFYIAMITLTYERYRVEHKRSNEESSIFDSIESAMLGILVWGLSQFFRVAELISAFASRRMEFSADKYEIAFGGKEQFAKTSIEFEELQYAYDNALKDCSRLFQLGELPDDFSSFVKSKISDISEKEQNKIDYYRKTAHHGLYATHPETTKRITAANKFELDGIFRLEKPASELFINYKDRAKFLTFNFYDVECSLNVQADQLVCVDEFEEKNRSVNQSIESVRKYNLKSSRLLARYPLQRENFTWIDLPISELAERFRNLSEQVIINDEKLYNLKEDFQEALKEEEKLTVLQAEDAHLTNYSRKEPLSKLRTENVTKLRQQNEAIAKLEEPSIQLAFVTINLLSRDELCPGHEESRENAFNKATKLLTLISKFESARQQLLEVQRNNEVVYGLCIVGSQKDIQNSAEIAIKGSELAREQLCAVFDGLPYPEMGEVCTDDIGAWLRNELSNQVVPPTKLNHEVMLLGCLLAHLLELRISAEKNLKHYQTTISTLLESVASASSTAEKVLEK